MASLLFNNLMGMKIFNNRRIAIYYLNNLAPNHDRFDLDDKDFIKKFITTGFISENEIKNDIIEYFNEKLKNKPYIQKLAKDSFVHRSVGHTFKL